MKVGNTSVDTPFLELGDNVMSAPGDWAHQLALALFDNKLPATSLPAPVKSSPEYASIAAHLEFLTAPPPATYSKANKHLRAHRVAAAWAERLDGPRAYIDAMLLGGAPLDYIAERVDDGRYPKKDLIAVVALYEVLFMHCRNASGGMLPKPRLHAIALDGRLKAVPADPAYIHWRLKAIEGGFESVAPLWGEHPENMEPLTSRKWASTRFDIVDTVGDRVRTGDLSTEDLIAAGSLGEAHMKRKFDETKATAEGASTDAALVKTLSDILEQTAPKRVDTEAQMSAAAKKTAEAEKRNLASEKKISKTTVPDRGPAGAYAVIDDMVSEHADKGVMKQEKSGK